MRSLALERCNGVAQRFVSGGWRGWCRRFTHSKSGDKAAGLEPRPPAVSLTQLCADGAEGEWLHAAAQLRRHVDQRMR